MRCRFFLLSTFPLVAGSLLADVPTRAFTPARPVSCERDSADEAVEALALPRDPKERMTRVLDILRSGSEAERRAVGQNEHTLDYVDTEELVGFLDPLQGILRDERDDWIASRILHALRFW